MFIGSDSSSERNMLNLYTNNNNNACIYRIKSMTFAILKYEGKK